MIEKQIYIERYLEYGRDFEKDKAEGGYVYTKVFKVNSTFGIELSYNAPSVWISEEDGFTLRDRSFTISLVNNSVKDFWDDWYWVEVNEIDFCKVLSDFIKCHLELQKWDHITPANFNNTVRKFFGNKVNDEDLIKMITQII